jgi:hypothetical protein
MLRSAHGRLVTGLSLLGILTIGRDPTLAAAGEAPKKVEVSLVILTPMDIARVAVLDERAPAQRAFIAWIKPVIGAVESQFDKETRGRTVVVQVTLHPDRQAEVVVAGQPAPTRAEVAALTEAAHTPQAPRSRIVDCIFRLVAKINGGGPAGEQPLSPPLPTPLERRFAEFRAAPTPAQLALLVRWARSEAIPLMAQMAADVDPKFAGVRSLGTALRGVKEEGPIDVAALTDKNPDYWRAMLEMAPGIPLAAAVRAALHVANGEVDAARRIVRTLAPFDGHNSGFSALLSEFTALADVFFRDVEGRIQKGIALNDSGKLDEALATYESVLKDYPRSAWACYERHQTLLMKAMKGKDPADKELAGWPATRKAILDADPLYSSMAQATSADELYDLLLRKETEELFKDKAKRVGDLLRYADIAVDLGQPGFAALIYWNLLTSVKPENYGNRNLIEDVLYCFEQLGATQWKENFKGDHAAEFARIDAERAKRRRESPANRVMAPKGEPAKEPK